MHNQQNESNLFFNNNSFEQMPIYLRKNYSIDGSWQTDPLTLWYIVLRLWHSKKHLKQTH